jgi:hypothetical protein
MKSNDFNEARVYTQLMWDPSETDVPLGALNDSLTRTFKIPNTSTLRYADGLEVEGRVTLIYDAIPEPISLTLVGFAAGAALFSRRR